MSIEILSIDDFVYLFGYMSISSIVSLLQVNSTIYSLVKEAMEIYLRKLIRDIYPSLDFRLNSYYDEYRLFATDDIMENKNGYVFTKNGLLFVKKNVVEFKLGFQKVYYNIVPLDNIDKVILLNGSIYIVCVSEKMLEIYRTEILEKVPQSRNYHCAHLKNILCMLRINQVGEQIYYSSFNTAKYTQYYLSSLRGNIFLYGVLDGYVYTHKDGILINKVPLLSERFIFRDEGVFYMSSIEGLFDISDEDNMFEDGHDYIEKVTTLESSELESVCLNNDIENIINYLNKYEYRRKVTAPRYNRYPIENQPDGQRRFIQFN